MILILQTIPILLHRFQGEMLRSCLFLRINIRSPRSARQPRERVRHQQADDDSFPFLCNRDGARGANRAQRREDGSSVNAERRNQEADDLSNLRTNGFNPENEMKVDLDWRIRVGRAVRRRTLRAVRRRPRAVRKQTTSGRTQADDLGPSASRRPRAVRKQTTSDRPQVDDLRPSAEDHNHGEQRANSYPQSQLSTSDAT